MTPIVDRDPTGDDGAADIVGPTGEEMPAARHAGLDSPPPPPGGAEGPSATPAQEDADPAQSPLDENVDAIKDWERALRHQRSRAERLSDRITGVLASGPVLGLHVLWFVAWLAINTQTIPGVRTFDPFPFPLLTLVVSLEAIFLSLFVLISQNRLARQADMRAHLDLQIDLLVEREMTAVLRLLQDVASHLGVPTRVSPSQIRDLAKTTDLHVLTERMRQLVDEPPAESADHDTGEPAPRHLERSVHEGDHGAAPVAG